MIKSYKDTFILVFKVNGTRSELRLPFVSQDVYP